MARAKFNKASALLAECTTLAAACDVLARAASPILPLARAAASGRLSLFSMTDPAAAWPAAGLARLPQPVVVIVGDDPGGDGARGPLGWKAAERMRRWCRWAMIHGAGGEAAHYAAAGDAAAMAGRVLLVETSSAHAVAWRKYLGVPGLIVLPPPGEVHPLRLVLQ